ncbi:MAG: HAD family hydrolase [Candidatus Micrarchaeota archaeon]
MVSFDLDGTLADMNFEEAVWFKGIPKLYALQKRVPFRRALAEVGAEYSKLSSLDVRWYDIRYWFGRLGLEGDTSGLLRAARHEIRLFPDTLPSLRRLGRRFPLIIISNATRDFVDLKLEVDGLGGHFSRTFSGPSDFGCVKGSAGFYAKVCRRLKLRPSDIAHVGDNYEFDFLAAREAGVEAYYLRRTGKRTGGRTVRSLKQFADLLLADGKKKGK